MCSRESTGTKPVMQDDAGDWVVTIESSGDSGKLEMQPLGSSEA